jgi:anti-sigma regulatory factor (Ser/Thr protein kinase)
VAEVTPPLIRELLLECHVQPKRGAVSVIRREVEAVLTPLLPADTVRDVVLVVSELCTNAIEAANGDCDVVVRIGVPSSGVATIEVEDCGAGFALDQQHESTDTEESGRGLSIVSWVADDLEVERRPDRTVVRALLRSDDEAVELARDLK